MDNSISHDLWSANKDQYCSGWILAHPIQYPVECGCIECDPQSQMERHRVEMWKILTISHVLVNGSNGWLDVRHVHPQVTWMMMMPLPMALDVAEEVNWQITRFNRIGHKNNQSHLSLSLSFCPWWSRCLPGPTYLWTGNTSIIISQMNPWDWTNHKLRVIENFQ